MESLSLLKGRIKNKIRSVNNFFLWGWRGKDLRPWDFVYLFEVMNYQIKDMEKYIRLYGSSTCSEKTARELFIASVVLDRLIEEDYDYRTQRGKVLAQRDFDVEYLTKHIAKHYKKWWD